MKSYKVQVISRRRTKRNNATQRSGEIISRGGNQGADSAEPKAVDRVRREVS